MRKLVESFEWINSAGKGKIPRGMALLKIVAKTPKTTIHPEDPNYPVRIFAEAQLMRNAASLVGRPIGLDHAKLPIYKAYVIDSEWNEEEKQLEALGLVPQAYAKKVADGDIKRSSIEYTWRSTKKAKEGPGKEFVGLSINRLDLLEKLNPGDSDSVVKLFEAKEQKGQMLTEVQVVKKLGEGCVWATKWASPEACIAANQDKEDPAAYCMAKVEAKEQDGVPTTKEDCEAAGGKWNEEAKTCTLPAKEEPKKIEANMTADEIKAKIAELSARKAALHSQLYPDTTVVGDEKVTLNTELNTVTTELEAYEKALAAQIVEGETKPLEEALQRVSKELKKYKENTQGVIDEATKEAKEEVITAVEAVIPKNFILRQSNRSLSRLTTDLRKVLREAKGE